MWVINACGQVWTPQEVDVFAERVVRVEEVCGGDAAGGSAWSRIDAG
jgi:hypothetical protein